jgi:hypothetical protein
MKNLVLVVFTAIITAAITMAYGVAQVGQPATQVVEVQKSEPITQVVVAKSTDSYWAKAQNKAFKAVEYGCTQAWKSVDMRTGCVLVIDLTRKGFSHDGSAGQFGVIIPRESGVSISVQGSKIYVEAKAKMYTFVVIDDKGPKLASQFTPNENLWDEKLLREFFETQMGGEVDTIWREGVSDDID